MEHLNPATADLPGIGFNILTLYGDVKTVKKSQNEIIVQIKLKQDGYDYVRIDDPSTLSYKLLPDGCKLADFVFIDDQGNVLDRLTHDLPL
jgi:cellulose biosynthesis protein BcsQ